MLESFFAKYTNTTHLPYKKIESSLSTQFQLGIKLLKHLVKEVCFKNTYVEKI